MKVHRRSLLLATLASAGEAWARGRTPTGGSLRLALPFPIQGVDPHDPFDPLASLFDRALFDTLFSPRPGGEMRAALAEDLPAVRGEFVEVLLRGGLVSAAGKAVGRAQVRDSLARARKHSPAIAALGDPILDVKRPRVLRFRASKAAALAALSSPLAAIVPSGFVAATPDGTGPFRASLSQGELRLTRNDRAALGPAFLESIRIRRSVDLQGSLRDFEAGETDLGWLGLGLFASRTGAVAFRFRASSVVVLSASVGTPGLKKPGAVQRLVDLLPRARLSHLGISGLATGAAGTKWDAGPIELVVQGGFAQLEEAASAIAGTLSQPGHEVRVRKASAKELSDALKGAAPAIGLRLMRSSSPTRPTFGRCLAASEGLPAGEILDTQPIRQVTSLLRSGVLGELEVRGGALASVQLAATADGEWDLGASFSNTSAGTR